MSIEHTDIDRIFDALTNLDKKLDEVKNSLGAVTTMASVSASKVEDLTHRIEKLELRSEEIRVEAEKLKETSQKTSMRLGIVWGTLIAASTVGLEFLAKIVFHL